MIDPSWAIDGSYPDDAPTERPQASLVTLHFLRGALRRGWPLWVGLACMGALLGALWTVVMPAKSVATVTFLMAHDPAVEPLQGMATDVSMLRTRAVASSVVDELQLDVTPEAFQSWVTVVPETSTVLVLSVSAPDDRTALARTEVLSENYLEFRTRQLRSQADAVIAGYQDKVTALQERVEDLTVEYATVSATGTGEADAANDVLTKRTQVNNEISTLQAIIQDTTLQTESIVAASHVLDPASIVPRSVPMRLVLSMASGLIGGLAVGVGLVVFMALTGTRLRRREEVALATDAPVRFSVGRLRGRGPWSRRIRRGTSASRSIRTLGQGLASAIRPPGSPPRHLALAAVDDAEVTQLIAGDVIAELTARGAAVFAVDLSRSGNLERTVKRALDERLEALDRRVDTPVVFRPEGAPSATRAIIDSPVDVEQTLPKTDPRRRKWDHADVVLTLVDAEPAVGLDHVGAWADEAVFVVTAGRSSAERLHTVAGLARSAGLRLLFSVLVGSDRTDESLGVPEPVDAGWAEPRRAR